MLITNTKAVSILLLLTSLLFLTSCLGDGNTTSSGPDSNLLETAESFDDLSTFSSLADSSDLQSVFSDSQVYTLFSPTNDAFENLDDQALDTLSISQLSEVLSYHVADSTIFTNGINSELKLQTLQGDSLYLAQGIDTIIINGGSLVAGNIQASNGILHATSKVLFPDKYLYIGGVIAKRTQLLEFTAAVNSTDVENTLQEDTQEGYTVFAPTNTAMNNAVFSDNESALQDTLQYHIIPQKIYAGDFESSQMLQTLNGQEVKVESDGSTITVNDSISVIQTNLEGTNGVAHTVDKVLFPPSNE